MAMCTKTIQGYFADPDVRQRIREYFGACEGEAPTAARVALLAETGAWPTGWETAVHRPASALESVWTESADLARSLRDRQYLLFFIELDYEDPGNPADPFLKPADALVQMEPAFRAMRSTLNGFGLMPLVLVTGRGYHFVGRIPIVSPVARELCSFVPSGTRDPAWEGLCCGVEFVAHLVLQASRLSEIPVVVNGVPVGQGTRGQAAVSVDFSYAGDPMDVRFIRSAFGPYQWHRFRPDIFGEAASGLEPMVAVPRGSLSVEALLRRGRTLESARQIASSSSAEIPDVTRGIERLMAEYSVSPLREFHRRFFASLWTGGVPNLPSDLPPCVMACLRQPNDLLLKPEHVQHLVRALLSRGWDASQIAALIRRAYEGNHGWGDRWTRRMDAAQRAAFEARVFGGLVAAAGTDELIDFNCVSSQDKGLCPPTGCPHDLRIDRGTVLRRQA